MVLDFESRAYGDAAAEVRDLMWTVAEQVVGTGSDVVLDWNSWPAARRQWAVQRAAAIGAPVLLHQLTASIERASEQAGRRAERGTRYAHQVTREGNQHLATLMEEPTSDEGLEIHVH